MSNFIRPLRPGVFTPVVTFFHPDTEDIDILTFQKHVVRVAQAGMGLVLHGSNGEAFHLSHSERIELIKAARSALDIASLPVIPLIVGAGGSSTRESIELCKEAAAAGADYAIVIAPGYFAGAYGNNKKALVEFFVDVAGASPIPVMIYNYPGASSGIDLDSDMIIEIAKAAPNTCGVKLTCASVSKMARIAAVTAAPKFSQDFPRKNDAAPFLVLGGFSDFLLPGLIVRSSGCITGLGNVAPRVVVRLFQAGVRAITTCDTEAMKAAQELQDVVGRADYALAATGIAGTKYILSKHYRYGGVPRKPLQPYDTAGAEKLEAALREIIDLEISFAK